MGLEILMYDFGNTDCMLLQIVERNYHVLREMLYCVHFSVAARVHLYLQSVLVQVVVMTLFLFLC